MSSMTMNTPGTYIWGEAFNIDSIQRIYHMALSRPSFSELPTVLVLLSGAVLLFTLVFLTTYLTLISPTSKGPTSRKARQAKEMKEAFKSIESKSKSSKVVKSSKV
jgi:hypothetical protein